MASEYQEQTKKVIESKIQLAMEKLHVLANHTKTDTAGATFLPHDNPCEKIMASFMKNKKLQLCYSTVKTVQIVAGRMLYALITEHVGLTSSFNVLGLWLWKHGWDDVPRCWHGEEMIYKVNEIDMPGTSEGGMNALKGGTGAVTLNKWGKSVVRVTQRNYCVCVTDRDLKHGQNSTESCGLSFTDGKKALCALKHAINYGLSIFPNASKSSLSAVVVVPAACFCNYADKTVMGKQMIKTTPFVVNGAEGINPECLSAEQRVACQFPAVLVFQCCNLGKKPNEGPKPCEFKISYSDLMTAVVMTKTLWYDCFNKFPKLTIPRFAWGPQFKVKNALLPSGPIAINDEDPFGLDTESGGEELEEVVTQKRKMEPSIEKEKKKKKRKIILESTDEDSD